MSGDVIDLTEKYGHTTLSNAEVWMMGQAFYTWVGATCRLGHSSPGSTLDYTTNPEALSLPALIMRDFVAWTSGRVNLAEDCEQRLRELNDNAQVDSHLAQVIDEAIA